VLLKEAFFDVVLAMVGDRLSLASPNASRGEDLVLQRGTSRPDIYCAIMAISSVPGSSQTPLAIHPRALPCRIWLQSSLHKEVSQNMLQVHVAESIAKRRMGFGPRRCG
jgi:hypothetical protein